LDRGVAVKAVALAFAVVLAGCTTAAAPTATPPSTAATTSAASLEIPDELIRFPIATIEIGGVFVPVAVADSRPLRVRGLREVTDLGDLAGMLFVFDAPSTASFTMRDTLIALDLHHLDADGTVLEIISMEPCTGAACSFPASVEFRYSLETLPGAFDLAVGDRIGLPGR
jgi:uncharacterized membrane protein (UPF0127 family)